MMMHPHATLAIEYLAAERVLFPTCNALFVLFFRTPAYPGLCSDTRSAALRPDSSFDLRWIYGADIVTEGLFFAGSDSVTIERAYVGNTMLFNSPAGMPCELARPGKLPPGAFRHEVPRETDFLLTIRRNQ